MIYKQYLNRKEYLKKKKKIVKNKPFKDRFRGIMSLSSFQFTPYPARRTVMSRL